MNEILSEKQGAREARLILIDLISGLNFRLSWCQTQRSSGVIKRTNN